MKYTQLLFILFCLLVSVNSFSQTEKRDTKPVTIDGTPTDTGKKVTIITNDSMLSHDPRKATFRSAVLPGWGQAYNKQYWKIPLVYAALGATAGFFVYNNKWYKKTREAYTIRFNKDTARYGEIDRKLEPLSIESLRFYRNDFRKNRDYSVLYFLLAWGLNVAEATVSGHLKQFDVSEDLSMQIRPNLSPNGNAGFSLVLGQRTDSRNSRIILP